MYVCVLVEALLYSVYCHRRQHQLKYYRSIKYKYQYSLQNIQCCITCITLATPKYSLN